MKLFLNHKIFAEGGYVKHAFHLKEGVILPISIIIHKVLSSLCINCERYFWLRSYLVSLAGQVYQAIHSHIGPLGQGLQNNMGITQHIVTWESYQKS
jgi:hypothetical protein